MYKKLINAALPFIVILDLIILIFTYIFAKYLVFNKLSWTLREIIVSGTIIILLFIILEKFEFSHSYRFKPLIEVIENIINFEVYFVAFFYLATLFNIYNYKNKFLLIYLLLNFSIFFLERVIIKITLMYIRKKGYNYLRFLIIGAGSVGIDFFNLMNKHLEYGVRIIGFLDDNLEKIKNSSNPKYEKIKNLLIGKTDDLEKILETQSVDNVIIALPMDNTEKISNILTICEAYGVKGELIPRYLKILSEKPSVRNIEKFTLIGMHNVPLDNLFNRFIKRCFDLCFAIVGLIITSPLFLIISILIKLESKGPVFFKQRRTGFNQKEFNIIKFRTMIVNEEADIKQATKDDPRKTKIGAFLRKTNLDELPQLINILKGEMSLIGPRPHMIAHTEEFKKKYRKYMIRHWVKPGLTGWAQVNGWRGDSDIEMRVKYDIEYIENWSIWLDLKIVFLTIFSPKARRHAH